MPMRPAYHPSTDPAHLIPSDDNTSTTKDLIIVPWSLRLEVQYHLLTHCQTSREETTLIPSAAPTQVL
jgi:hypothetical protein